jgi:RNA polymerase-binding transcription factor DksA
MAAVAYVVPILARPDTDVTAASSAALTIPVCVLVAESIAWIAHRERRSRTRAETLARAASALTAHLEESQQCAHLLVVASPGRLGEVDRALQKIEEGTYGLSDDSGESIPRGRLEAVPEAIRTVEEQQRFEQERRPPI